MRAWAAELPADEHVTKAFPGIRYMDKDLTKVRRWMTPKPITIEDTSTIVEAIHLLKEKNIRRLPVVRKGKLVGVVTEKSLKDFTPSRATSLDTWEVHYLLARTPVSAAMNPRPHQVKPEDDIADVAQLLHDRKLNGVLVMDDKAQLVGILTTTNALEALMAFAKAIQAA